jgi:hypothetical protein
MVRTFSRSSKTALGFFIGFLVPGTLRHQNASGGRCESLKWLALKAEKSNLDAKAQELVAELS